MATTDQTLTAYALPGELDLNRLALHFGQHRRYRWEEPMVLELPGLTPGAPLPDAPHLYLYFFGGLVFVDTPEETAQTALQELQHRAPELLPALPRYRERFAIVSRAGEATVSNEAAVLPTVTPARVAVVCFALAKSVALERIEEQVEQLLDEMEGVVQRLGQGRLALADKRLAQLAGRILTFKHSSLSSIMILDKPETAWDDPDCDRLYLAMAEQFELNQRYGQIRQKAETLLDITQIFASLAHAHRAARLEWIIIVLIAIEVVIYLVEILRK